MTLPKIKEFPSFLKGKHPESFLLPAIVVIILVGIIAVGFLIPKKNKADEELQKQLAVYTEPSKVELEEGKEFDIEPAVFEITPEQLHAEIEAKQSMQIIQVFQGDSWNTPHIKGSLFMRNTDFDQAPTLDKEQYRVFVSDNGLDSAIAISKLLPFGYLKTKNVNLKGGLSLWKEKGFELEN